MLKICSNRIAKFFVRNGADPEMEEVYAYGIECTLSTLLILTLLMMADSILRKPLQMLVFILAWLLLRLLVGGAHANSHWMCTIISVGLGTVSVWLSDYINMIPAAILIGIAVSSEKSCRLYDKSIKKVRRNAKHVLSKKGEICFKVCNSIVPRTEILLHDCKNQT